MRENVTFDHSLDFPRVVPRIPGLDIAPAKPTYLLTYILGTGSAVASFDFIVPPREFLWGSTRGGFFAHIRLFQVRAKERGGEKHILLQCRGPRVTEGGKVGNPKYPPSQTSGGHATPATVVACGTHCASERSPKSEERARASTAHGGSSAAFCREAGESGVADPLADSC